MPGATVTGASLELALSPGKDPEVPGVNASEVNLDPWGTGANGQRLPLTVLRRIS